jgi:sec-independent protein translocase protein TatB
MFGGLDPEKLLMVLLVAVVVVGPERLPRIARQIGSFFHGMTEMRERLASEVREALPDLDLPKIPALPKRGLTGYLTAMMASTTSQAGAAGAVTADVVDGGTGGFSSEQTVSLPMQAWVNPSGDGAVHPADVPAGWNAVGAPAPGYASGSLLAPVPSLAGGGPLSAESELSFDEPSWN